ncbi:BMP family ABC transporter substrate-binding protein [Nocardioides immobilis]|uniref:BMP family ABC transporter substrate-binding protein n=1 Tax=Nocardioides immobilis TaxID=2049295 RepID=A0A417Y800_9ACTN|nr:BMP family ABC transporter substrate-binding protein [Nocardioides immobilis]RHW28823.1 BMP family ABC transporter substrate-binding protein [Nocardioides immobilis]
MKRTARFAAVGVIAALALTGCGKNDDDGDDNENGADANASVCESADGDGPAIGLAYDVGGRGDQSFNDSAYAGLENAVEEYDATCVEGEATDGEAESAREDRLRNMADQGLNPIIGVGFAYSESVNAVAPDFPDISFAVIDGFDPDTEPNDNVAYLGFAEEQGSFLVGVAAALKTETDQLGFVGGVHNDLIKKFEAGFVAGATAVNPDIKVAVNYIEESDLAGFNDPEGGNQAATALYEGGADIVYHASGASGSGVFEAAATADAWAIGVDSDQYLTAPADQQEHILTSMLKRVDVATFNMVESVVDGEPLTSYVVYDLSQDGVGYSTSGGFIDDITTDIDEYADQIISGEIQVPTAP